MEQVLDGDRIGTAFDQQRGEPGVNDEKLFGKRRVRRSADGAADDHAVPRPVGLDAAVAGALGTGVDPENLHASEASISFSEMSKFDQTCWTSS